VSSNLKPFEQGGHETDVWEVTVGKRHGLGQVVNQSQKNIVDPGERLIRGPGDKELATAPSTYP